MENGSEVNIKKVEGVEIIQKIGDEVSAKEVSEVEAPIKAVSEEQASSNEVSDEEDSAKDVSEKHVVCSFYLEGKCRFGDLCRNIHEGEVLVKNNTKKKVKEKEDGGGDRKGKKRPMKTALDVIKRIQWDPELTKEFFTVGYLDRFEGVMEAPFTTFTWEDLASLDWDTLAIPQHRIQYFKYKTTKVWDKNERLDVMFGSTGHQGDIFQLMEEVDEKLMEERLQQEDDGESSSDDEDDMVISVDPFSSSTSFPMEDRSTHFLAVRLTSADVISNLQNVQQSIIKQEEILRDCCMKEGLFHITLGMFRIMDIEGIQAAVDLVEELKTEAQDIIKGRDTGLEVRNLNNFGQRVVYAEVHPKNSAFFNEFTNFIKSKFDALGEKVKNTNSFEFIPHVTLAKVSRPISRIRRSKYINQSYYAVHSSSNFGMQKLDNLQLCIIESSTRFDGFYTTLTDVHL